MPTTPESDIEADPEAMAILRALRRRGYTAEQVRVAMGREASRAYTLHTRHEGVPHPKHVWFCAVCGYAPHEPLMHIQEPHHDHT